MDTRPFMGSSSRFSGRLAGGKKHEIYAAPFGGHLFYDLFLQGLASPAPDPLLGSLIPVLDFRLKL